MRVKWAAVMILLAVGVMQAQEPSAAGVAQAVRTVLQAQVVAWNHDDLEGFMAGYWKSPELTFFSGANETRGWEPTLERYRGKYQSGGSTMGTLSFSDLKVQPLGADAAFVRGRFQLVMPDGKQPRGAFTLIFRKFPEGWKIVHDHTCAE